MSLIARERSAFHEALVGTGVLALVGGVASNADGDNNLSRAIAFEIATTLGARRAKEKLAGQTAGKRFEEALARYLEATFLQLEMLRPGDWEVQQIGGSRTKYQLKDYEPYGHLSELATAIKNDETLRSVLGNSYEIKPDVMVLRRPMGDADINARQAIVGPGVAERTVIRASNSGRSIVHAILSCKWTLRSDRAQNARSEALNVIRNRTGRTPHFAVVTGEPLPSRLASLALGTGDVDTVYHFALPELIDAVAKVGSKDARSMLETLVNGSRLRDISDLPLDLTV